jgi:hypothetical protein
LLWPADEPGGASSRQADNERSRAHRCKAADARPLCDALMLDKLVKADPDQIGYDPEPAALALVGAAAKIGDRGIAVALVAGVARALRVRRFVAVEKLAPDERFMRRRVPFALGVRGHDALAAPERFEVADLLAGVVALGAAPRAQHDQGLAAIERGAGLGVEFAFAFREPADHGSQTLADRTGGSGASYERVRHLVSLEAALEPRRKRPIGAAMADNSCVTGFAAHLALPARQISHSALRVKSKSKADSLELKRRAFSVIPRRRPDLAPLEALIAPV